MQGYLLVGILVLLATANAANFGFPHEDCPTDEDPYNPTHLPVPDDCTKFYKCEGGLAFIMDCPLGLHWSVHHNRCEWPGLAIPKCNSKNINFIKKISAKIIAIAETPIRHPDCPLDDDPQNPTHLVYPKNCTKFYKCLNGLAYIMDCPAGLHWNDNNKMCDWPELANCKPSELLLINLNEAYNESITSEGPIKNNQCPSIDVPEKPKHLPYPNDCSKFYKCSYGYAYPMECPAGEHFGVEINRCDWPRLARCDPNVEPEPSSTTTVPSSTSNNTTPDATPSTSEVTTTSTTTSEPLPPGISCNNVPHGTLYPHPDDCKKFIHCDNGRGVIKICPAGLHFSPSLLVCEWPKTANCHVKF